MTTEVGATPTTAAPPAGEEAPEAPDASASSTGSTSSRESASSVGSRIAWDRWFVVLAVVFGVFLAVATPPLQEHDAAGHLVRVDRMSRGTFVEPLDDEGRTAASVDGCLRAFIDHHSARGASGDPLDLGGNWAAVRCTEPTTMPIPTSSLTSPVPYVANAAGYTAVKAVGGGVNARVLGARLASLAAYIAAVWAALRLAPKGRALLFAVALLPSSLALAASVHADATGIAAAILAVALVLRARDRPSRAVLVGLGATLVVLALSKNLYSPFLLLLLLVPAAAFAGRRARLGYLAATAGAGVVAVAAWSSYAARNHYVLPPFGVDSEEAQSFIVHHPLSFLASVWRGLWDPFVRDVTIPGFVEVLGGLRGPRVDHLYGDLAPLAIVAVAALVLALAVLADPGPAVPRHSGARRRIAAVCAAIVAATVLLVYVGIALTANPPGVDTLVWIQGRYFIPLAALLAFAAGRQLRHQSQVALAVPAGSLLLLLWIGWRVFVVFY